MTITPDEIVLFRIAERLGLSLIVLLVALVVMVGFWRSVQKLDVSDGGKLGVAGSFALSTPVFVLLAIIGYAWVSLSFPIQVTGPAAPAEATAAAGGRRASSGSVCKGGRRMPGRPGPRRRIPAMPWGRRSAWSGRSTAPRSAPRRTSGWPLT